MKGLAHKKVAVTGCCGTIGSAIVRRLAAMPDIGAVLGIDNNESGLFALEQECRFPNVSLAFGDVRDESRLRALFAGMDVVLHTAALKHVAPCEMAPTEAIRTNILGVENVIAAARANGVGHVTFTSSDKAANPTNVMGTTKLMGERLITAAQIRRFSAPDAGETVFSSTRFGNVLGSHGSVFPLFCRQIAAGGPVTLTDPGMTRFVMSTAEAVEMVLNSILLACGGEVFVSKMKVLRIEDLATVMIEEIAPLCGHEPEAVEVKIIGRKPGEKLYEELLTAEESHRSIVMEHAFAILPAFRDFYQDRTYSYPGQKKAYAGMKYSSHEQPAMSRREIADYLRQSGLLNCIIKGSASCLPSMC